METSALKTTAYIELQDLVAFKAAVAASLSLTLARLLGYVVDGVIDLPSFPIEVDGEPRKAHISAVAENEQYAHSVIVYFFNSATDDSKNLCCFALAQPAIDSEDWIFGPNIVLDDLVASPYFYELALSTQFAKLEART